ncbi:MAG: cysteine--tRNA ligase [Dehalococcoidia bacterium]|nr:cysteine--tRNA ligase [Dehalococcoidia bacterium]
MVRLHDTLSNSTIPLPEPPYEVKLYVCGITPYAASHIGHAVPAIIFDALRRYLEYRGYSVRHITNFTDIDDKLIDRAQSLGTTVEALAKQYSDEYLRSLRELNVLPAAAYPRATGEIAKIIEVIQGLEEKGFAYASGGDVYYRVRRKEGYGKLSHRKIDDLLSGARIDPTELKEDPLDFALWKGAKPGEPSWDSPWGPGRPGWHIECSAMAMEYLGPTIDIHGGGADLIFPHHENEIAQSEAFTGQEFARIWMHNALLRLGSEKMSKSVGNIISLEEVLERWGSDATRVFVLSSHYRSPLTFTEEAMDAAKAGAERLRAAAFATTTGTPAATPAAETITDQPAPALDAYRDRFTTAMDDDLGTAQALAVLFDLAREINRKRDSGQPITAEQALLRELAGVLGLTLAAPPERTQEAAPFIDLLVSLRSELRGAKQWALADRVRDGLAELGIELHDSPEGTTWTAG